jgi:hypothetical protein
MYIDRLNISLFFLSGNVGLLLAPRPSWQSAIITMLTSRSTLANGVRSRSARVKGRHDTHQINSAVCTHVNRHDTLCSLTVAFATPFQQQRNVRTRTQRVVVVYCCGDTRASRCRGIAASYHRCHCGPVVPVPFRSSGSARRRHERCPHHRPLRLASGRAVPHAAPAAAAALHGRRRLSTLLDRVGLRRNWKRGLRSAVRRIECLIRPRRFRPRNPHRDLCWRDVFRRRSSFDAFALRLRGGMSLRNALGGGRDRLTKRQRRDTMRCRRPSDTRSQHIQRSSSRGVHERCDFPVRFRFGASPVVRAVGAPRENAARRASGHHCGVLRSFRISLGAGRDPCEPAAAVGARSGDRLRAHDETRTDAFR